MWRPRVGLLAIGLMVLAGGARAQDEVLRQLPYYEDQMAGVKLGWQARTITGLWNLNDVSFDQAARLRKVYRMPDQIIMRLGTKIPIFTGSGSGNNGVYNFYLGTYGRGNSVGGAGGGGEGGDLSGVEGGSSEMPADAMGPSEAEIRTKVHDFIAQAQGVAPPTVGPEGEMTAPPTGVSPGPGSSSGPEIGDLGFTDRAAELGPYAGLQPDEAEAMLNKLQDQAMDIINQYVALEDQRRQLGAQINVPISEYDKIDQQQQALIMKLVELLQEAMEVAANSQTLAARGGGLGIFGGLSLYYHVFHIGKPNRDIVFCYRMDRDTWLSVTINFYTWQVDGITVANTRGPWAGARTSTGPDGTPGIALGDSLEQIFNRYGWPDGFESFYGKYLMVHYYDTNNVGFMLEHTAPKVWRVVRIMIEPRPNGKERQLGGVQLGLNAQQLLTIRRRGTNRLVYGQPHAVERPNHRISVVTSPPAAADWPPGVPLDPRIFGGFAFGGGGGGAQGPEGEGSGGGESDLEGSGSSAPDINIPSTGGNQVPSAPATGGLAGGAFAQAPGARPTAATDRYGRPVAMAQSSADAGLPGGAGGEGLGAAGEVESAEQPDFGWVPYPMPWRFDWDEFNVEPLCGAEAAGGGTGGADLGAEGGSSGGSPDEGGAEGSGAGGGGGGGSVSVSREALAAALSQIYADGTGQIGYNLVFGGRSSPGNCDVDTLIPESEYRWDYSFPTKPRIEGNRLIAGDTKVEFGLDMDGLTTQIGVMGVKWGGARTRRGIALGSTLRDVFLRYGPPLLYNELTQDVNEQSPNVHFASYARDELGRPRGNINLVLQDKYVTAMSIVQIGVQ